MWGLWYNSARFVSGCLIGMAWRLLGIGWYIPFCLLLGAFLGYKLDEKFDTGIALTLVGLTLGLVFAFIGVFRIVQPLMNEEGKKEDRED